ncbi:MAG: HlyC/CorC family transporter [Lachnospiraceae bacterium]|nr:HlyC/CorC family transporter [Lachnospiraceae bacterium]
MDSSDAAGLICLFILIGLSAFFSSAETSLMSSNKMRLRSLASEGDRRADILLTILENQSKMLSTILIGNNIVNLSASSLVTTLTIRMFGNMFVGVATGILTLAILIFGEITPKTAATIHAERVALRYARIVQGLMIVFTPLVFVAEFLSRGVLWILRIDPNEKSDTITEEELRTIVEVSHEEGIIEKEERKMINNVVDFGDSLAKDIMVPRINMSIVEVSASYEELMEAFRADMFTRLPVYEENVDNIVGIINMKDLLLYKQDTEFCLKNYLREAYFTYEFKKTSELFIDMRQNTVSMAVVLDEYGAVAGLITLEDLLEEIVGEIRDEYDEEELKNVQKLSDMEYVVEGSEKLDDLNDLLGLQLESEEYDSIGGFLIGLLEHFPNEGEEVEWEGIRFLVDKMDNNRIEWIHMYLPEPLPEEEE